MLVGPRVGPTEAPIVRPGVGPGVMTNRSYQYLHQFNAKHLFKSHTLLSSKPYPRGRRQQGGSSPAKQAGYIPAPPSKLWNVAFHLAFSRFKWSIVCVGLWFVSCQSSIR